MKILIVLSSTAQVPTSDRMTGTWFEELAAPYFAFTDAGAKVTLASIEGGPAPIDPWSEGSDAQTDATRRFSADADARKALVAARSPSTHARARRACVESVECRR